MRQQDAFYLVSVSVCLQILCMRSCLVNCSSSGVYRAAVYEHNVTFPVNRSSITSRMEALKVINNNMAVYDNQAYSASRQNASIIIFPEYGLVGIGWTRKTILPFAEYVSDPKIQHWVACTDPDRYPNTEIQQALSCIALKHSVYIVASLIGIEDCITGPKCPSDNHYIYSTTVVYDNNGIFLARYYKQNLNKGETLYLNTPITMQSPIFNVNFVNETFGILSSRDILGENPFEDLQKKNVSNIVFPNAWIDELPLQSAIGLHSAFAQGMRVNLLSANLHLPSHSMQGSGIYGLNGLTSLSGIYTYNTTVDSSGILLVGDVHPIPPLLSRRLSKTNKRQIIVAEEKLKETFSIPEQEMLEFWASINGDQYKMIPIRHFLGSPNLCHNSFCCSLWIEGEIVKGELFAFGVFEGIHSQNNRHLQACIFIKCATDKTNSCGQPATVSNSYISKMSFSGNFSSNYVLPEVLVTLNNNLGIVTSTWLYQNAIIIDVGIPGSPLTIAMMSF